jgi:hypothetical protein
MDGRTDEWMDGWMDGEVNKQIDMKKNGDKAEWIE